MGMLLLLQWLLILMEITWEVVLFVLILSLPTVAEAKAYGLGIQLAGRLQVPRIIVDGDASDIPKAIKGKTNEIPWGIRSTILSIREHVKNFSEVSYTLVSRELILLRII